MPPLQSRLCRSVLRPLQPFEGLIGRIVRPVAHGGLAAQPFNGAADFDKVGFAEKYNAFIQSVANHMTIFAPFIPALSALLTK